MRRILLLLTLASLPCLAASCDDASVKPMGTVDMAVPALPDLAGRAPDLAMPPAALGPCLDRPDVLPRPPVGVLPCELIPPSS